MRIHIVHMAILALCLAVAPGRVVAEEACSLGILTHVPLREAGSALVTEMQVNGKTAMMLVDTGSFLSFITTDAAQRLGLHTYAPGTGGSAGVGATRLQQSANARDLLVGGVGGLKQAQVVSADEVAFGQLPGKSFVLLAIDTKVGNLDGAIGADILGRYDIDLDVIGSTMTLYKAKGHCASAPVAIDGDVYEVPLRTDDAREHRPVVDAKVQDHDLHTLIDTGATHSILYRDGASRIGVSFDALAARAKPSDLKGIGPSTVRAVSYTIPAITIGGVTIQNLPVEVTDETNDHFDFVLGRNFARKVHIWISNSHHVLMLQIPPRASAKPPPP